MFQHQGIWLPDGEKHFPDWMSKNGEIVDGKGTYQIKKLRAALAHCKQFRVAVDVGAHVGLWSMHLAKRFQVVHAFEPMHPFRQCWLRNVDGVAAICWPNALPADAICAVLYPLALGKERARVKIIYDPADSGGTHVSKHTFEPDADMIALDDLQMQDVDFIKIDVEGFEHHVVEGARATILRCRPTIIVEQKPHKLGPNFGIKGTPAVDLLKGWGYVVRAEISGDYILTAE